jgi:hypothetical protein
MLESTWRKQISRAGVFAETPVLQKEITQVDFSIRRIHLPSGVAPLGTPVRARFCNGYVSPHAISERQGIALIYQTDPLPWATPVDC